MMDTKEKLRNQITDATGNVIYTNIAHWEIVGRLKAQDKGIKIASIILTALSTGGFIASILAGNPSLSWVGGLTSALALALNLYTLNFRLTEDIKSHTDAANELRDVRERYKSLLVDFDDLSIEQARKSRDQLMEIVSDISKKYPGTDNRGFAKAKKRIDNYVFNPGEAEQLIQSAEKKRSNMCK